MNYNILYIQTQIQSYTNGLVKMTDWKKVWEILDRTIEVYEVRDPKVNEERYLNKKRAMDWIMKELKKGPIEGGTLADTAESIWNYGTSEWDAMRDAIRCIYDDRCAICGKPAREVHHIRPKHLKGKNHPRNLILLCNDCHDEVHRKIDDGIAQLLKDSLNIPKRADSSLDRFME